MKLVCTYITLLLISQLSVSDQPPSNLTFPIVSSNSTVIPDSASKIATESNLDNTIQSFNELPVDNIILVGSNKNKRRVTRWLNDIAVVPKGYSTLKSIEASGHTLTIQHSASAGLSSGRTIAPMTRKITNGEGDNILIVFDAEMDDRGTHRVFGVHNELIEFNAIQNLYHELAHAMHQMQGTWRYFASEKQAIEEENEFRKDLAIINGEHVRLRYRIKGIMMSKLVSGGLGYQLP